MTMTAPVRYRPRPVLVDAWQYLADNGGPIVEWVNTAGGTATNYPPPMPMLLLRGRGGSNLVVSPGDWVIRDTFGVFDRVSADPFERVYEVAYDGAPYEGARR